MAPTAAAIKGISAGRKPPRIFRRTQPEPFNRLRLRDRVVDTGTRTRQITLRHLAMMVLVDCAQIKKNQRLFDLLNWILGW